MSYSDVLFLHYASQSVFSVDKALAKSLAGFSEDVAYSTFSAVLISALLLHRVTRDNTLIYKLLKQIIFLRTKKD